MRKPGVVLLALALAIGGLGGAAVVATRSHHHRAQPVIETAKRTAAKPATTNPLSGMHLVFDPSFATTGAVNPRLLATCFPWVPPGSGCTNYGNPQDEWFLPSQVRAAAGVLTLTSSRGPVVGRGRTGRPQTYACRSGMVTTYPSLRFTYGYVRIVARLPAGSQNLWPALWLLPANESWPPEIDMVEVRYDDLTHPGLFFHPRTGGFLSAYPRTADLAQGWHTFGLLWTPRKIVWFIDERALFTVTHQVPSQPMYVLASLQIASGKRFPSVSRPGACTGSLAIRSLQVWRP